MNNITLAGLVVTSPSAAFAELRERPRFWLPLLVIIVATILQLVWYYSIVDIEWLKDHMFSGNARVEALPPEAQARMMSTMTQKTFMWSSVISVVIGLPLIFTLLTCYYLLAGKITNVQQTFKQWFSLVAWSGIPTLIGVLTGAVILATHGTNAQVGPSELQVFSLNELFFQRTPTQPGFQLLSSLSLISVWGWVLSVIGVKTWSNRSLVFSSIFVLLPLVVVYGVWALFAFKS